MHLLNSIFSTSLLLFVASSAMAQPVFRHKTLHLVHSHHAHPHHGVHSELDVFDFDVQKVVKPILSTESPSASAPTIDENLAIPITAMPKSPIPG